MERTTIDGKEYGKIPFDLERWQSGDFVKVVTRDDGNVEQLTHFKTTTKYCIIGVLTENGDLVGYDIDGCYDGKDNQSPLDLHLIIELPQPKEYWQNVYKRDIMPTIDTIGHEYLSQSAADKNVADASVRIGYFKTTIIEGEQPKYEFIPINQ